MNLECNNLFDGTIKLAPNRSVLKTSEGSEEDLSVWQPRIHSVVPGRRH